MRDTQSSLTTTYAYNTRPGGARSLSVSSGWAPKIDCLLAEDYQFLGFRFSDNGYLFRGMSRGLANALIAGYFGFFQDPRSLCSLERALNVLFISHELSDAVYVSRLWEARTDSVILVVRSELFNSMWDVKRAAVLGFAEPGMVFKYPFLVDPFPLGNVAYFIVHPSMRTRFDQLICEKDIAPGLRKLKNALTNRHGTGIYSRIIAPAVESDPRLTRSKVEDAIQEVLRSLGVTNAQPIPTGTYPRRC